MAVSYINAFFFKILRKYTQLFIDQVTFVISGLVALIAGWLLATKVSVFSVILSAMEAVLLIVLGLRITDYADLAKGH